ncbi:MAG TPA: twin-arginine translocase TatA/TatE family subunit [Spirochaetota bacterium]|nr:twin-arginine translocase TatA/TatE family subunit [Spirochaetota bacterium]HPI90156.1 twin-arginine translocase TatA/TatE family subunit [Spirochaetota bacterium]HPR48915.1 twin-arginine translocase TatA/TatE family subunit [Spirochaetota bacterium]
MNGVVSPNLAFIGGIGVPELVVIFFIVLILFGAGKIPKIAKDLGGGIREFKKSITGEEEDKKKDDKEDKA